MATGQQPSKSQRVMKRETLQRALGETRAFQSIDGRAGQELKRVGRGQGFDWLSVCFVFLITTLSCFTTLTLPMAAPV